MANIASSLPAPDDDVSVGQYIGKYRVVAELGRGGMAHVLLAVAQGPAGVQKLVALKVLRGTIAAEPETLSMFLDEARLAAQLNHGNVVKTYEVGAVGNQYVLVMEYLEGQPLSAVLRRAVASGAAMPLPLLLRVFVSVLAGLHYAHELTSYDGSPLSLVHRDMSPQNVFVTYDGQVKVVDFGIAKAASSESHTAAGMVKGKLSYMAPEQMIASGIDRRADIYSVGCMLWSAATGKKLWEGVSNVDIARNVMQGQVPKPSSVNPACSPELEAIIMKALAFEPSERFQTALELQEAIERFAETLPEQPKEKDVGAFAANLFEDTRSRLRVALERELKLAAQDPRGTGAGSEPGTGRRRVSSEATPVVEVAPSGSGGRRYWLPVLLLALAASLAVFWIGRSPRHEESAPAATTLAARVAQVPELVDWTIAASPDSATLTLDGRPLSGNPARVQLPRETTKHVVSASAPGFQSTTRDLVAATGGTLELALAPLLPSPSASEKPRAEATRGRGGPKPIVPAAAAAPVAPPVAPVAASCDEPFSINAEGIKVLRRECM